VNRLALQSGQHLRSRLWRRRGSTLKIRKLKIVNYKSFEDSGEIELSNGFNFVVGANNSGKTALLEALRLNRIKKVYHRSIDRIPEYGSGRPTYIDVEIELSKAEFASLLTLHGDAIHIPYKDVTGNVQNDSARILSALTSAEHTTFRLRGTAEHAVLSGDFWPTHTLFTDDGSRTGMLFRRNAHGDLVPTNNVGHNDSLPEALSELCRRKVFVFNAQRFEVSRTQTHDTAILSENASNLPSVLSVLRRNDRLFDKFSSYVRDIFPSITSITIAPSGTELEIFVYNIDTERPDMAMRLGDSGTGLSQVMAILYVALTTEGGVIAVDEPASFLHPSASRKLMQILSLFPDNQYILSTHSSEIISAAAPDRVLMVRMNSGKSAIDSLSLGDIDQVRAMLNEIGASLSDVFGLDSICWVEGQTEQECFPLILQSVCGLSPIGVSFRAMRHTSDFDKKKSDPKEAWELYQRISEGTSLVPPAISFNFDRDARSSKVIEDMIRQSKGRAHFLAKETYENYLLHPKAISVLIGKESESAPSIPSVRRHLRNAIKNNISRAGVDARSGCHGARVLKEVFGKYVKTHSYNKMEHSIELTRWICQNDPKFFKELGKYVQELVPPDRLRVIR
jgi:energy-coupling factor transporter ATP-binding protein EcfA2/ribosomal protein S24E